MSEIKLSPKYQPLFKLPLGKDPELKTVHTVILTGGRFSVKSFAISLAACIYTKDYNHRILYTRYTMKSAEDSIIPEFQEKITMLGCEDSFKQTKGRIEGTQNDSKIVFKGIKTSEGLMTANLKSLKDFSCFILDEGEEMPDYETWEKISLSIRVTDVQNLNIIIMNPATKEHWVYQKFFLEKGVPEGSNLIKDGVLYIHTTYLDCPREFIPDNLWNKFEKARKAYEKYTKLSTEDKEKDQKLKKDALWYKNVVLGGWKDAAEGVIFEDWEHGEWDNSLPYCYGHDFGFEDNDATIQTAVDHKNKLIYAKEVLFANHLGTDQLYERLEAVCGHKDMIIGDAAHKRIINDLWHKGLNIRRCKKGAGSVVRGIKALQGFKIIVCGDSPNLVKSLNNYVWHDKRANVPRHEWSHCCDALRYGAMELIEY